jgi:hypothetical protein
MQVASVGWMVVEARVVEQAVVGLFGGLLAAQLVHLAPAGQVQATIEMPCIQKHTYYVSSAPCRLCMLGFAAMHWLQWLQQRS